MSLQKTVETLLMRFGADYTVRPSLEGGSGEIVRGVLQPVFSKTPAEDFAAAGILDERRYLFLCPPPKSGSLRPGMTVERNGDRYVVLSGESVAVSDEMLYCWAMLCRSFDGGKTDE